jgi:hypothetical protein
VFEVSIVQETRTLSAPFWVITTFIGCGGGGGTVEGRERGERERGRRGKGRRGRV